MELFWRTSVDGYAFACCALDLWPFDLISTTRSRYIRDLIVVKLPPIVIKMLYSPGFSGYCLMWLWSLTFWTQKLISTSTNPNTYVAKIGWNSLHWFFTHGFHKVFGMHRLAHSLTDGQTRIQNASGTAFQRWWRQKNPGFHYTRDTLSPNRKFCIILSAAADQLLNMRRQS